MNHAARSRERQLSALTPPPPLYATAVVGYRAWVLTWPLTDDDDPKLKSLSIGGAWRPGVNHARCYCDRILGRHRTSCDIAPGPCGECGLYAVRTVDGIPTMAYPGYADHDRHPVVVAGAIAGWGRVDVHQNGFRAEHAQILAITAGVGLRIGSHQDRSTFNWTGEEITWSDGDLDLIRRAAEYYRVPYVSRDDLAAEALLHGDPPPTLEEIQ